MRTKSPMKMPPGVIKGASPADATARWYDSNLVRWVNGRLQPVGGFRPAGYTTASPIRKVLTWADNTGAVRTALLCEQHLYIIYNGVITNVSPTTPIAPPVSQMPVGGYGNGLYGAGLYGTQRDLPQVALNVGNTYTLATWGQTLLAMTSADGRLLQWDPSSTTAPNVAVAVTNAPINNRTFAVTPEEFCLLFGWGGDPRHFGWCSQANLTDWNVASVTNTAGEFFVEPSGTILSAINLKAGTLFFTENSVFLVSYQGATYIYTYSRLSGDCTPVSGQAVAVFGNRAVWLAPSGFWTFDGSGVSPVAGDLFDWFKTESDPAFAREYTVAVHLGEFPEVYWFFPSVGSTLPDRYVVWNYADNWWAPGYVGRTAGEAGRYNTYPTFGAGTTLYFHEIGTAYSDGSIAYARTASMGVGNGQNSTLFQLMPDHAGDETCPVFEAYSYENRINQRSLLAPDDYSGPLLSYSGYVDVRLTGRDFSLKISSPDSNTNGWSVGETLVDIRPRGYR